MEHMMKLQGSSFNDLKSGKKKREYRLNDDKRKSVRVGDTIRFLKLPNLDEEFVVDVKKVEVFDNWFDCYSKYFEEDFKDRYDNVFDVVQDTYNGGYYSEEESKKNGCVVFTIKKHRVAHFNSTVCYLKKDGKVLMIKFSKKWGCVYSPVGGKIESGESPLDCIIREYYEETGLSLIHPRLQGISYWKDLVEGIIFIYTAEDFEGDLTIVSSEGKLEWIKLEDLSKIRQFEQNKIFTSYLFKDELFEGKFLLDSNSGKVLKYKIRHM